MAPEYMLGSLGMDMPGGLYPAYVPMGPPQVISGYSNPVPSSSHRPLTTTLYAPSHFDELETAYHPTRLFPEQVASLIESPAEICMRCWLVSNHEGGGPYNDMICTGAGIGDGMPCLTPIEERQVTYGE